ncbi:MAG: hypothetical protein HY897_23770 [Deltaproteobacteria bacterium]|nr:hypothetical protein [Deltaproteobacteria bacterium]
MPMPRAMSIAGGVLLLALCAAAAACSFSPSYEGSKLDCSGGKACPKGWYCPDEGEKVCRQGEPPKDAGDLTDRSDPSDRSDPGPSDAGRDGGARDTGGTCKDECLSENQVECASESSYRKCTWGSEGCLVWGPEQYCTGSCENNECSGCSIDCTGKDCGDDGCSGSCGSCTKPPAATCKDNRTLSTYNADGTCSGDQKCVYTPAEVECTYGCFNGACADCTPSCGGKECGDDGCGVDCGACDSPPQSACLDATRLKYYDKGGSCQSFKCVYTSQEISCPYGCENAACKNCQKNCGGKQCGSDNCGGDCGACGAYAVCNASFACECTDGVHINCNSTWSDGCEVDRNNDAYNCGNCNNNCSGTLPNTAVAGCQGAQCKVVTCAQGFGNCNGTDADGCEKNLQTDNDNCTQCGKKCPQNSHCAAAGCACDAGAAACGANCCGAGEMCCNGQCTQPLWVYREPNTTGWGATLLATTNNVYAAGTQGADAYVVKIDTCGLKAASKTIDYGGFADGAMAIMFRAQFFIGSYVYLGGTTGSSGNGTDGLGVRLTESGQTFDESWKTPYFGSNNNEEIWDLGMDTSSRVWFYGASNITAAGTTQIADWLVVANSYSGGGAGYAPVAHKLGWSGTVVGRRMDIYGDKAYTCGALYNSHAYVGVIPTANCDYTTVTTCMADAVFEVNDSQYQTEFRDIKVTGSCFYVAGFRSLASDASSTQAAVWRLDMANGTVLDTFYRPATGKVDAFNALTLDAAGNVYACGFENYGAGSNTAAMCQKLSGTLAAQWEFRHDSAGLDFFATVDVGPDGSVYPAGTENDSTMLVKKCDSAGNCGN